jgi:hypothetical protein
LCLIESGVSYQQDGYYASGESLASMVFDLSIPVDEIFVDAFASPDRDA